FLLLALRSPPVTVLGSLLHSKPLLYLGKYSYGLYVLHRLLLLPLRSALPLGGLADFTGSPVLAVLCFEAIALIVSFGVACAVWHLYEARFLRLKRYFA